MAELHMSREDCVWRSSLSFILLMMREKTFQTLNKGIQLTTMEAIDRMEAGEEL